MDRFQAQVEELLRNHHAVPVRQRKHKVYKLDTGAMYTESISPSDVNATRNRLKSLQRVLARNTG